MVINVLGDRGSTNCSAPRAGTRLHTVYRSSRIWFVLFIVMMAKSAFASNRQKNDTITLKNGDVITCEIRSLEKGQLTIKQPA